MLKAHCIHLHIKLTNLAFTSKMNIQVINQQLFFLIFHELLKEVSRPCYLHPYSH